jgi:hypothetical protein
MFTRHRLPPVLWAIALATSCCDVCNAQLSPAEQFFMAATQRWEKLDPAVKAYARRADDCSQLIEALGATYDAVMTTESGRFRDTLMDNYRRNLPTAIAERLNLQTATPSLLHDLDEAYDYLHQPGMEQFKVHTTYKELDEVIRNGREAVRKVNAAVRMPSLPDPIPDPVAPAEILEVRYRERNHKVDTWYTFEAVVKNNAHYTDRIVKVKAFVREGEVKLKAPLTQEVTIQPGKTKVLSWKFMVTEATDFDIAAQIIEPE